MGSISVKDFVPNGLILPSSVEPVKVQRGVLSEVKFEAPKELILDGYCTPVENQGDKPWCAAYAATSYAENVMWRKRHYHKDLDPKAIYTAAKELDKHPELDGTTIEAVMEALLAFKDLGEGQYKIKTFYGRPFGRTDGLLSVKFAIHEYGCCVAGFNITKEWLSPSWFTNEIKGKNKPSMGGHAVLICGYDKNDRVKILGSWGKSYGKNGFVWLTRDAFEKQFVYGAVAEEIKETKQ